MSVEAVNLGTAQVYYKVVTSQSPADITASGTGTVAAQATALAPSLFPLTFTAGLAPVTYTWANPGAPTVAGTATSTLIDEIYIQYYVYNATTVKFDFIGHAVLTLANVNILA
jgi:hypothetical protein